MEETIAIFEPLNSGGQVNFYLSLILSAGALIACIWILRKKGTRDTYNRRMLMAMLFFFVFLIGGSTAFYAGLNMNRTGTIRIEEHQLSSAQHTFPFEAITDARIITHKTPSLIDPSRATNTARLLVIENNKGKTIMLPEDNYEIEQILATLKKAMQ